jgi:glucose/arabinose dehydrogenase
MTPPRLRRSATVVALAVLLVLAVAACGPGDTEGPAPAERPPDAPPIPPAPGAPAPEEGSLRLTDVGTFDQPLFVTAPEGDSRIFVVEKTGRVKLVSPGREVKTFLDLSRQVSDGYEQGLLSIAFAPDYPESGLVYVNYTDTAGDTRVVEFRVSSDPDRLDPSSRRELMKIDQPFSNHNGGLVAFDPTGMLIVGMGDGGAGGDPGNRAQDLSNLLGKLLRIDPRPSGGRPYGIPRGNPFVGRSGARPEIWALGLRNPWRFAFDEATGDLYVGDVGQNHFEELNVVAGDRQPGANYGWPAFEGTARFKGVSIDRDRLVRPVLTYPLGQGTCSIIGGYVVTAGPDSLRGRYLFGDLCQGDIMAIRVENDGVVERRSLGLHVDQLSSFGKDGSGRLYATSLEGKVFRIDG